MNCFSQVTKVVIPAAKEGRPHREFGFVHFADRATAVKLVDDAEKGVKPSLDGNTLEVRACRAAGLLMSCSAPHAGGKGLGWLPWS